MHQLAKPTAQPHGNEIWGHPKGLYVLFLTEMWERFSFYGMRALLVFYLTKHFLFGDQAALGLYGAYVALGYATPVIGGLIADRYLGQRVSVTFGAILMCLGHLGMAVEGSGAEMIVNADGTSTVVREQWALQIFYLSLALLIIGIGFLKPNIATIVSHLYPEDDPRKASAYTLFQMGIMLGAALSAAVCGYLGETWGWSYGFGAAGVGMLIGLVIFQLGQKHLNGVAEPPPAYHKQVLGKLTAGGAIYLAAIGAVVLIWLLVQQTSVVGYLLSVFSLLVIGYVLVVSFFFCSPIERDRMLVLLVFQVAMTFFAVLFEQAGGSLNLFADRNVDRQLLGFEFRASQLQSIMPMTIVVLAPLFAWLWPALARIGRDPRSPVKYGLTMIFMGLGFGLLAWATTSSNEAAMIGVGWLIAAYILFGIADLLIVSVSYSTVTSLSLPRIVGMMMGTSMLAISAANYLAAKVATFVTVPDETTATEATLVQDTLAAYHTLFFGLACAAAIAALVLFMATPLLSRRMHGVH